MATDTVQPGSYYCPGIMTRAGFCPETEDFDDDHKAVVLYFTREAALQDLACAVQMLFAGVMVGDRTWGDAEEMYNSLAVANVEVYDSGIGVAFDDEGNEMCVDHGYLDYDGDTPPNSLEDCELGKHFVIEDGRAGSPLSPDEIRILREVE